MKLHALFSLTTYKPIQLVSFVLIIVLSQSCGVARATPEESANKLFTSALDAFKTQHNPRGSVAAAFVYDGKLQPFFLKGDAAPNVPVTEDTIFETGSVTKTFTGILTAYAIENNVLALNDTVAKWFPEYKSSAIGKATIKDLATHTSGLPKYPPGHTGDEEYTTAEFEKFLKTWKPHDGIGQKYSYSDPGYWLLRMIVDKAFKNTDGNLLDAYIFRPLDMASSTISPSANLKSRMAVGYTKTNAPANPLPPVTSTNEEIAGDVQSSIKDMAKYLLANVGIGNVPQALSAAMKYSHQSQAVHAPHDSEATVGWFTHSKNGAIRIDKDGQTIGFTSYIGIVPEKQMGVVILANKQDISPTRVGQDLLNELLERTGSAGDSGEKRDASPAQGARGMLDQVRDQIPSGHEIVEEKIVISVPARQ